VQTGAAVLIAVLGGGVAGWAIRLLLARLPRGVVVRAGILEASAAALTGVGVAVSWPGPWTPVVVWAGLLAVGLSAVDIAAHRLPDALTLPAIPLTLLLIGAVEYAVPGTGSIPIAVAAAVVTTGLFWALAAVAPRAMGRGDVKLVPSLALMTGYASVASAVLAVGIAFVLGALLAVLGMAMRRLSLTSAIPFGPFLLAGCWLVLAFPGLVTAVIGAP